MTPTTTRPMIGRALALVTALAFAGAVAACGDDDGESSGGGTVIETDRDTETPFDDDNADAASPEDLGIEVGDCARAISAVGQTSASLTSPGVMEGGIAELEDLVPAELQSDVDVLSDAVDEMQAAFDRAGTESGDRDATETVVDENRDTLDTANDAMDNVEDHFKATCE